MKTAAELLDHRNIMIAVKKGLIRREEFRQALWEQRRIQAKTRSFKSLGDILIDRGVLTETQRESILPPLLCRSMGWSNPAGLPTGQNPQIEATDPATCVETGQTGISDKSWGADLPGARVKLSVKIENDGLLAVIAPTSGGLRGISLQDIKCLLDCEGIVFGRVDDETIGRHLSRPPEDIFPFPVAAGTPPDPGRPDEVRYHFDINPFRVGTLTENGIMDWKDHGELPKVAQGDLLAEIIPGEKARPGKTVFGQTIEVPPVQTIRLRAGKGVEESEDRLKYFAKVKGHAQVTAQGLLSVMDNLVVSGDVGIETGHVLFDGHIEVRGSVQRGFRVKGGSLKAREILSQDVEIDGDVVALRGIFGAKIRAGGRVKANHINKSSIIAADDVVAAKEIVDCKIITNGKCILDGGTILSSEICAKMGIRAKTIGSAISSPSSLVVGVDQIVQLQVAEYRHQISDNQQAVTDLNRQIQEFHTTSDRLNTQLGEIAQVQDRHMVEKRRIAESIEAAGRKATDQEQETMERLADEIKGIDGQVTQLMAEDETAQKSIIALRNEIVTREEVIQEFKIKIEEAIAQSKQSVGIASLQVSGQVFPRTHIKGPNDAMMVEELAEHMHIKEQKNTDPAVGKTHVFKVAGH
jgi:uncharacterized protein (DUF342 family)